MKDINEVGGALWKCKRNELVCLIRTVGQMWQEDPELLEDYIVEQINTWHNSTARLDEAISCFKLLKEAGKK